MTKHQDTMIVTMDNNTWTPEREMACRRRCALATPGPWGWRLNLKSKQISLEGNPAHGCETVMDFVRYGIGGAAPRFRNAHCLLERADKLGRIVEGREHHAAWFQTIAHPDAEFIAAAAVDLPEALAEIDRLRRGILDLHRLLDLGAKFCAADLAKTLTS